MTPFSPSPSALSGAQQRTYQRLLDAGQELMERGTTPTVAELAQVAGVSRATAYRYFPSQEALITALAEVTQLPIRYWQPQSLDARTRLHELLDFTYGQITEGEAHHRAVLQLHLSNTEKAYPNPPTQTRGHRRELLRRALEPLQGQLSPSTFERLLQGLSPYFGLELLLVFRDLWGLDGAQTKDRAHWVIDALLEQALAD